MLKEVGIVLNERENRKAEIAEQLEQQLEKRSITSFRLEISPSITETLYQERPSILILDYILGDYTTGLDVLAQLRSLQPHERPKVYFLTDEPNASVATEAMRLGAEHFLQVENPRSLPILLEEIEKECSTQSIASPKNDRGNIQLKNLVAASEEISQLVEHLKSLSLQKRNLALFYGPRGSGKKTFAEAYLNEGAQNGSIVHQCSLRYFSDSIEDLFLTAQKNQRHSLLITDCENDDGELLEYLARNRSVFEKESQVRIAFTTQDLETARGWEALVGGPHIELPALTAERQKDLLPLIQKFCHEAGELLKRKLPLPGKETLEWLSTCTWSKNVSQLRSTLLDAYTSITKEEQLSDALKESYERSVALNASLTKLDTYQPSTLRDMLEVHRFRYRIVAAKTGLTVKELRAIISQEATS